MERLFVSALIVSLASGCASSMVVKNGVGGGGTYHFKEHAYNGRVLNFNFTCITVPDDRGEPVIRAMVHPLDHDWAGFVHSRKPDRTFIFAFGSEVNYPEGKDFCVCDPRGHVTFLSEPIGKYLPDAGSDHVREAVDKLLASPLWAAEIEPVLYRKGPDRPRKV